MLQDQEVNVGPALVGGVLVKAVSPGAHSPGGVQRPAPAIGGNGQRVFSSAGSVVR
jgi:hypothetical protein